MQRRGLLAILCLAAFVLVSGLGWITVKTSLRSCSLDSLERQQLVLKLDPERLDPLLERVLGAQSRNRTLQMSVPTRDRDFGLDQGPQRVCASGAALLSSRYGDVNVLVRVYDSAAAARDNARVNLNVPMEPTSVGALSGAGCQRTDVSGGCWETGAQTIEGSVSVVVLSRQLTSDQDEAIAAGLAAGIADLAS